MAETIQISCTNCGAVNRVPLDKIQPSRAPICGRCKTALPAGASPVIVTDGTFSEQVEHSPVPVLVDFWAPWCGPCRILSPVVEQLAGEFAGRIRVAKMNVDDNPATASRFDVRGIPALLLFRGGREAGRQVGAQPKSELKRWLERAIA
jgi:thioredoxin 2